MGNNELSQIATDKQIRLIQYIKKQCNVTFNGKTKKDVWDYIGEWLPKAKFIESMDREINVPTYKATKTYPGNSIHGQWEETINLKDTIAHDIFEGEIIRGRNPAEALMDFQIRASIEALNDDAGNIYDLLEL